MYSYSYHSSQGISLAKKLKSIKYRKGGSEGRKEKGNNYNVFINRSGKYDFENKLSYFTQV